MFGGGEAGVDQGTPLRGDENAPVGRCDPDLSGPEGGDSECHVIPRGRGAIPQEVRAEGEQEHGVRAAVCSAGGCGAAAEQEQGEGHDGVAGQLCGRGRRRLWRAVPRVHPRARSGPPELCDLPLRARAELAAQRRLQPRHLPPEPSVPVGHAPAPVPLHREAHGLWHAHLEPARPRPPAALLAPLPWRRVLRPRPRDCG
mmetsp:Transcript_59691/g.140573  ORF Transcript_59691/g.140573 Transcript_59691/m.140573 type:complete len:200 (+) Transcript_59691:1774-2373(+)